ncbi:MAG TPA: GNAT family N-acetyltransferase [Pengzhenrongella sp.]
MVRRIVDVVPVTEDLLGELIALWLDSKAAAGHGVEGAARATAEARLQAAMERPDVGAHLGRIDGATVGFVITSENVFGLAPAPELAIEQLFVSPDVRHKGVARALLTAVVTQAERDGCDVIVGNVPAQSRDANRFFARLGFSSILVRRVASTAQLRRKLSGEPVSAGLEQVIRRRRSLRGRAVTPTRTRSA